jgi:hypothetical protein
MNFTFTVLLFATAAAVQPLISQPLTETERANLAYTQAHYTSTNIEFPCAIVCGCSHGGSAPVILTTSLSANQPIAAVGVAQNVTPYGFTLALRNADIVGGRAGIAWVSIGWPAN